MRRDSRGYRHEFGSLCQFISFNSRHQPSFPRLNNAATLKLGVQTRRWRRLGL